MGNPYDLAVDGVNDFYLRRPLAKRLIRKEGLSGLADGTNTIFYLSRPPALSTSVVIYLNGVVQAANTYTLDADGGVVTFNSAPSVQPIADYTALPMTNAQAVYFAWGGFHLIEALWQRGFQLSNSLVTYTQASPTDADIYVVLPGTVTDPPCGGYAFSTSTAERLLMARAIEIAYLDAMLYEAALGDIDITQRVGGIRIAAAHRTGNIVKAREQAWMEWIRALYSAQEEYYPNGEMYGQVVTPPHTNEYIQDFQWQLNQGVAGESLLFPTFLVGW